MIISKHNSVIQMVVMIFFQYAIRYGVCKKCYVAGIFIEISR